MRAASPTLNASAWNCLVLLGLLLGASLAIRAYTYTRPEDHGATASSEAALPPIDLGAGAFLPHARAGRYRVVAGSCAGAALVTFALAGPYGPDPSLEDAPRPGDRVFFIYRGWNLGRRFATIGLNAIYFASKAYARLSTGRDPAAHDMAVKIVLPVGCDASPDTVLATFRTQVTSAD